MSDFVLSQVDARGIATITLNRPDKANAYDYGMLEAVGNHFEHHGADAKVRAIVLRGSGKHCDIVLADRSAFFSVPEVRLGFTPGPLSLYFSRALGVRAFRRYGMTGERFGAEEGLRVGFVHELCDAGGLDTALAKQVEEILMAAPFAAMGAKSIALRLQAGQIPRGLEHQLEAEFVQSRGSAEAVEGKASFTQKRKPNWYKAKAGS
jgi:enoyl-CoA hydratase/carnithine racemase